MKVVAILGSPRFAGNSSKLLHAFATGAAEAGAEVTQYRISDLAIAPCRDCGGCERTGRCVIPDDHPPLADRIQTADVFVLASPVYYCGFPGMTKTFIDRFQSHWNRRYRLMEPDLRGPRAYLLAVGGARSLKNFDGMKMTFQYLMGSVYGKVAACLTYPQMDLLNAVEENPGALKEAFEKGLEAARSPVEG